jgi:hypothetical protein
MLTRPPQADTERLNQLRQDEQVKAGMQIAEKEAQWGDLVARNYQVMLVRDVCFTLAC